MSYFTAIFGISAFVLVVFMATFERQIADWFDAKADELRARAEKIRKEKNNGIHENI